MAEIQKTICPLDCPDSCGIIATVKDGRITRLQGDPEHPFTRGFLCRKMRHYPDRIYSPDRVLYPQIRSGKKGEGKFRRITWDEAWDVLVTRLTQIRDRFGGEALLPYSYAGNMGHINRWAGEPFFHRYGASGLKHTICSTAAGAAWKTHCGTRPGRSPAAAADAGVVVAWGINIKTTNVHFWPFIQKSRRKGGKLVVIDPYRNKTAKAADLYLPVRPGGDTALALGTLKAILETGSENRDYINSRTEGFDGLESYVTELGWQEIEKGSGVSQSQIELFAGLLAESPGSFFRIGMGLTRNTSGSMSVRAILCLAAALGSFEGKPGQGVLLSSGAFSGNKEALLHPSLSEKPTRQINMIQLGEALTSLKPAVQALFVFNSNPLSVAPDASRVRMGLEREGLFTVVHEQLITPTARYADLLLPATTSFENSDVYTAYGHFYMGTTRPVIPPSGEAISNFDLFQTLGRKMGYTDAPFFQSLKERLDDFISGLSGIDPSRDTAEIETGEWIHSIFADPNLSNEPAPFQFTCQDLPPEVPVFPSLIPNVEFNDPDLKSRFPLKLITPPASNLLNSTFGEAWRKDTGRLLIHPLDAAGGNIQTGQKVRIRNHRGSTIREARVTEDTQPGLIVAEGIYWENPESGQTGINELTSQKTTDLGEGSTFHESRARIEAFAL